MPKTQNNSFTEINNNQAIYEILSKILLKWRYASPSAGSPQNELSIESVQNVGPTIIQNKPFQDDQIIRETVVLTPEELLISPRARDLRIHEIPETRCITLEKEDVSETQRSFHKGDEDVPKTVVQALDTIEPEEKRIPETIVFSTQKNVDTDISLEQEKSIDPPLDMEKEIKKESKAEVPHDDQVPETIIFRKEKHKE
ncbi:MAG: hypothetical protein JW932_16140 [Deltaproteobacteria bacterium]|nr:hypothetical protein [Deltaproteobacteria bacterium]